MISDVARLIRLARPARTRLIGAILLAAGATGAAVALLAVSGWLIARASFEPPVLHLMVAVVAVRFFGISRGVLRYAERLVGHDAAFTALATVRQRLYAQLERLAPIGRLWRRGDLLDRLVADVDAVPNVLTRAVVPAVSGVLVMAAAVIAATIILPSAGAVLATALVIGAILGPWTVARADQRESAQLRDVQARRADLIAETVLAASDPGLAEIGPGRLAAVADLDVAEARLVRRAARRAGVANAATMLSLTAASAVIWWLGSGATQAGTLAAENATLLVLLPLGLLEVSGAMQPAVAAAAQAAASARRIFGVLDTPAERARPGAEVPAEPWPIVLRDAALTWPGADEPSVRDVDLHLAPGRRIAIAGPSGSGKSTVLAGLMEYADVTGGDYLVAGAPHAEYAADTVRSIYAWCDQQAHLFDTTIAENVRLSRPGASDEQIAAALDAARLSDWIASLPHGAETMVGQFGVRVSGGQRQRIGLARALLADRPVLLADEPTASLDRETADRLMRDLLAASGDRALVVVTHDRRYLGDFDVVLDLEATQLLAR
ncbi:thiol reductant ABC exporter subunit CydC [Epidermidibacterium keratini]|uniref:Thiol reductant ABC exporter subunit CydC n=1 Tax=Epidermidibacterium keratini TaxID=1891644 RepID=A0A7L4YRI4_9ACTN|nr:thiol reductant ABC exporter subunit CydC [Epidermidibacterium keratini]QHC01389.1 thiol reductant ABC exporter subunit CydC [Epidermidibacterium keratini]